jgi:hypothetical protein
MHSAQAQNILLCGGMGKSFVSNRTDGKRKHYALEHVALLLSHTDSSEYSAAIDKYAN